MNIDDARYRIFHSQDFHINIHILLDTTVLCKTVGICIVLLVLVDYAAVHTCRINILVAKQLLCASASHSKQQQMKIEETVLVVWLVLRSY